MSILPASKKNNGSSKSDCRLVNLAGREVAYSLIRTQKAKSLRLMVSNEKGLEVVIPSNFSLDLVEPILNKKQKWILGKLAYFEQLKQQQNERKVLYRGREYEVETRVVKGTAGTVKVEEGKLLLLVPAGAEGSAAAVLEGWFRAMARLLINQRVRVVNKELNLEFNRVFIRGQKTRWGSCSRRKNLNFNWRLVMAPLQVIDYIVAHELLHLIQPDHSQKFWSLVERVCPDYKDCRKWLKTNGHRLKFWFELL